MAVISVEVPDKLAEKFTIKNTISLDKFYDIEETNIDNWHSVKIWEKASVVLDYLKSIR